MLSSAVLVFAVCLDIFAAAVSFGSKKIKIPFLSASIISLVGAFFLFLSLSLYDAASGVIPPLFFRIFGGVTLLCMALWCAFGEDRDLSADKDLSGVISFKEAIGLSFVLSVDALTTGFCFGSEHIILSTILSVIMGFLFIIIGRKMGEKFGEKSKVIRYLSAFMLFVLSITKIIFG